jgi:squalene synthase HpnC
MTEIADILSGKGENDENFPVASKLIAPQYRGPILAFYRFVRAADDVVDHAQLSSQEKHTLINRLEAALLGKGKPEAVAEPLRKCLEERGLSSRHPLDLLTAFRQDIDRNRYKDWDDLIRYCRYSAMPVGRFVLDVHGEPAMLWPANDALCAALQVINHMQDCGKDFGSLNRVYLPSDILARHGATYEMLGASRADPALRAAIRDCANQTTDLLRESARFAPAIRNTRLGLEVAVIQRLAETLNDGLEHRDPLSEPVHLGKTRMMLLTIAAAAREGLGRFIMRSTPSVPAAGH